MISIIVPFYNTESSIGSCIDSILHQTYSDIEIILVDDGSTDHSADICKDYQRKDKRITVYRKENGGVSSARNKGIDIASGKYIMFLDSDDKLSPHACEVLRNTLIQNSADCVVCGTTEPNGHKWTPTINHNYTSITDFNRDFPDWLDSELLSPVWNKIYKKSLITKLFHEEMSFGEDLCFSLDYLKNCKCISFITDTLHFHDNINTDSLTHKFNPTRFKDIEHVMAEIILFSGNKSDKNLFKKYIRDCINYMHSVYSASSISTDNKNYILNEWHKNSFLNSLNISNYNMAHKDRLMLLLWKKKHFLWYMRLIQLRNLSF